MMLQLGISVLAMLLLSLATNVSAQSTEPIGSEWVYGFSDSSMGIVYSGTYTYSCERITNCTLGGTTRTAVEYKSVLSSTAAIEAGYSGLVEGSQVSHGTEYYDLATGNLIGHVTIQAMHLEITVLGGGPTGGDEVVEFDVSEWNETAYLPPGGHGADPTDLEPGTTWQKNYTKHSKVVGHIGDEYYSDNITFDESLSFEFVGVETITVPAGQFYCTVFEVTRSDGVVETEWYSVDASAYAKVVDTTREGEVVTYELRSYTLKAEDGSDTPIDLGSELFRAVFFMFVAATALAMVYAGLIRKRMRPPAVEPQDSIQKVLEEAWPPLRQ